MNSLLDAALKGTLFIGIVLLALRLRRGLSPAFSHLLILGALGAALLLPLIPSGWADWEVDLLPRISALSLEPGPGTPSPGPAALSAAGSDSRPAPISRPGPHRRASLDKALPLLWGLGAAWVAFRLLVGMGRAARLRRRSRPLMDKRLQALAVRLSPGRSIALRSSPDIAVPLAVGWLRPVILMPDIASSWSDERRRLVLMHEIAHIKRGDVMTTLLAHLVSLFHWFNPVVWLALRRLYIERERACDDYVLSTGTKASVYAAHLLDIARYAGRRAWLSATGVAMAGATSLEVRVMSILNHRKRSGIPGRAPIVLAGILTLAALIPLAGLRTWARGPSSSIEVKAAVTAAAAPAQSEETLIRERLARFYAALKALDYRRALSFFSRVDLDEISRVIPFGLIKEEGEAENKRFSLLVLTPQNLADMKIDSRVKTVVREGEGYLVAEDLTITRTDPEGRDHILVKNPDHEWRFELIDGTWMVDRRGHDLGAVSIKAPATLQTPRMGLCLALPGFKLLTISEALDKQMDAVDLFIKSRTNAGGRVKRGPR